MLTYLFDASAAVEIYVQQKEKCKKPLQYILQQKRTYGEAALFIPNICIAEVFNTFAQMRFEPRDKSSPLDEATYTRCLDKFRDDVHWGKTLYPYDLNRYHIVAADWIVLAEHHLPRMEKDDSHLSTFDILIIAMACELAYIGQRDRTSLVTCVKRLNRVCKNLNNSDFSDLVIPGPLGKLNKNRWIPPTCIYLPEPVRGEVQSVLKQSPYNY